MEKESIRTILSQHQRCSLNTDEAVKCILDIFDNGSSTKLNLKISNQDIKNIGNSVANNTNQELIDLIYGMYLSMKAHPDYQTGQNQEFIDYVNEAEKLLEKVGKI